MAEKMSKHEGVYHMFEYQNFKLLYTDVRRLRTGYTFWEMRR